MGFVREGGESPSIGDRCRESVRTATRWLLESGIQNTSGCPSRLGGFNSWYDLDLGRFSFVYSEITGYALSALSDLFARERRAEFLERAELGARWLKDRALHACGAVRTRCYYDDEADEQYSFDRELIYAFDNGMVVAGLVNLHLASGDQCYLETASRMARFLLDRMASGNGGFLPIFDPATGRSYARPDKWSTRSGPFHAKLAVGLGLLFEATGEEEFEHAALEVCRWAIRRQDARGAFANDPDSRTTHLHAHLYACEGILWLGLRRGLEEFVQAARRGVGLALSPALRLADGGIASEVAGDGGRNEAQRSDVLAQTLRLGCVLGALGELDQAELDRLPELYERLSSYQWREPGSHEGGFLYGADLDGVPRRHVNSWCTMFALQAIRLYGELRAGSLNATAALDCFV